MSTTISSNMFKPHYLRHQSATFVRSLGQASSLRHSVMHLVCYRYLVILRCHPTIARPLCFMSHALPASNPNQPSHGIAPMVMHSIAQALKCPCVGTKKRGNLVSSRACRETHEHHIAGHLACQACPKAMWRHA